MFTLSHFAAHQQHLLELQREAEEERLLRIDRTSRTMPPPLVMYAIGWLGGQLIQWGEFLQHHAAYPTPVHAQ